MIVDALTISCKRYREIPCTYTGGACRQKKVLPRALDNLFASVELRVSVSHDLGEITCDIAYNLIILFADILLITIRYIY